MSVAVEKRPGATSLVQAQSAAAPAGTPGKQTLTQQLPPVGAASPSAAATYTVQLGDTVAGIAARLGTTAEALKAANAGQLKSFPTRSGGVVQGFTEGAVLQVPGAASGPSTPAPTTSAPTTAAPATTAPTTGAPTSAATTPATAAPASSGGIIDSLVGAIEGAWEYFTGSSSTPAAEDPAAAPGTGTAPPASSSPTTGAPDAAAPTSPAPAPPPLADLSDAERGQHLSTFGPGEVPSDPRVRPTKAAAAAQKRGQWLGAGQVTAAGAGKSGDEFVAAIDQMNAGAKFTEDQNQMIAAAREFAAAPKPLTPAQEAHAVMDWSQATLALGKAKLDEDLKARLVRFVRFAAWANLVTGPTVVSSVMRSAADAHKLSVAWMFCLDGNTDAKSGNTLTKPANRQQLVKNVTERGGSDLDGNMWLSPTTVEGLKAHKDDDAALYEYIKTTAVADANKVKRFDANAAEGYEDAAYRHPNVLPGSSVSKHLTGGAVDMSPPWVFNNKFDPLIDAMCAYFGLHRPLKDSSVKPEHWHYETLGTPPGAEQDGHE